MYCNKNEAKHTSYPLGWLLSERKEERKGGREEERKEGGRKKERKKEKIGRASSRERV